MRALKIVGYILATFLILWIIVAFFSPKELKTSQSVTINRSSFVVFDQVNNLKLWNNWSPWIKRDPDMKQEFSENHVGKGAIVRWVSKSEGSGEQSIIESHSPTFIKTALVFNDWDGTTYSNWNFEDEGENITRVTWNLESSELPFMLRPLGFSWNSALVKDYKSGLQNLKTICENLPKKNENLKVKIVESLKINYIGKRLKVDFATMGNAMGNAYQEIMNYVAANKLKSTGKPFSVYYDFGPDQVDFMAAIPIEKKLKSAKGFDVGVLKAGKAATISHFGSYNNLQATYHIITNWIKQENYQIGGYSWEVYITDPHSEPDTSKWETQIYFPIKN